MEHMICPYCNKPAVLDNGWSIYGTTKYGKFWKCADCDAYVGCHGKSTKPLGTLANAELREHRKKAHSSFDYLWKNDILPSRSEAYAWLAREMGIEKKDCHIGMFSIDQCKEVITCSVKAWETIYCPD